MQQLFWGVSLLEILYYLIGIYSGSDRSHFIIMIKLKLLHRTIHDDESGTVDSTDGTISELTDFVTQLSVAYRNKSPAHRV